MRRRQALASGLATGLWAAGCGEDRVAGPPSPEPSVMTEPPCDEVVRSLLEEGDDPFLPLTDWLQKGVAPDRLFAAALEVGARLIAPESDLHAVLGVGAARVLSGLVTDESPLMPLYRTWNDQFELVWTNQTVSSVLPELAPLPDPSTAALLEAWDAWDEDAADVAMVALYRDGGREAVVGPLTLYGQRNHDWVGHTTIWTGHALRVLDAFGWGCAEPVLRSLARAIAANEAASSAGAFYDNIDRLDQLGLPEGWRDGADDASRVPALMAELREGDAETCVTAVLDALADGVGPRTLWTALDLVAVELAVRWQHDSWGVHELDASNAFRHLQAITPDPASELLALLQAAAWRPEFQAFVASDPPIIADTADAFTPAAGPPPDLDSLVDLTAGDGETAARGVAAYFAGGGSVGALMDRWPDVIARYAEEDVHHQKYHAALLEETQAALPEWREAMLLGITMRGPTPVGAGWLRYDEAKAQIASLD